MEAIVVRSASIPGFDDKSTIVAGIRLHYWIGGDPNGQPVTADNVVYEAAVVGGIPGWWCRPGDAAPDTAILYLHGGAYVAGSAHAYCHFAGQIAARAAAAVFVADYGLRRKRL
jgi:monoterpene epsilon-lactone hydrolase